MKKLRKIKGTGSVYELSLAKLIFEFMSDKSDRFQKKSFTKDMNGEWLKSVLNDWNVRVWIQQSERILGHFSHSQPVLDLSLFKYMSRFERTLWGVHSQNQSRTKSFPSRRWDFSKSLFSIASGSFLFFSFGVINLKINN